MRLGNQEKTNIGEWCGELLHVHFHVHASNLFNVHAFRLFSTVYFWLIVTSVTSSKCCIVGKCHVHQSQVNMSNHEHQTCCNEHKPYQFSNLTLLQKVFRPKTTPTRWLFRTQLLTCKPGLSRIFATHREYSRSTELLCQLDDLSDYTDEMDLPAASHHLRLMRNHLEHVRTILRLRMTIQMIQLARRFRNHSRQQQRIPIVNLDFR